MSSRQLALQELYEKLSCKFGNNPGCNKIIMTELQKFSQLRTKITVEDINKLESDIKRLIGYVRPARKPGKLRISAIDRYHTDNFFSDSIKKIATPLPSLPNPTIFVPPVSPTKPGIKLVDKAPDHILFPSETSPYNLSYDGTSDSRDSSPYKFRVKEHDDWGKIVKADHIKFLNVS